MLLENMSMALHAIRANKMRSFLTMLGIIIGIGSVIAIVSIGDTMRSMITDIYADAGITRAVIYIWPADGGDMRQSDYFNLEEMRRIGEVFKDDIEYIDANAYVSADALSGRNKVKFQFQGIDYNYPDVQNINIIYGRNLNEADIKGCKKNVVLEAGGAKGLFGTEKAVGKTFRTTVYGDTDDYNVVGVYKKTTTPFEAMMTMNSEAREGFMPYTLLNRPDDLLFQLNIFAKKGTDMKAFSSKLVPYIARLKGRESADVTFDTVADEMSSTDTMMGGLAAAVGGIAAISLLVGGIGIMNIMLVSVTERTQEIGIRKALGARTHDVMVQFLTESAILSVIGGILGVLIGAGIVMLGGAVLDISVVVKPYVVIAAVGFSALVGLFFGIYPASKAAQKDPIEALRYE